MEAIRDLNPGYFAFVMATGIVSIGTFLLGPSWLSRVLLVVASAGLAVLSVVFPLGMYSVATLSFGKASGLTFMEPLSRFMLWVAVSAWVLVAPAFFTQFTRKPARRG